MKRSTFSLILGALILVTFGSAYLAVRSFLLGPVELGPSTTVPSSPLITASPTVSPVLQATPVATVGPESLYEHGGFTITPPSGWIIEDSALPGTGLVTFTSPAPDTDLDNDLKYSASLSIVVDQTAAGMTLDAYTEIAKAQLKRSFTDFELIDDAKITTDSGHEGYILGWTSKQGQDDIRNKQLYLVTEDAAYVIIASALAAVWDDQEYNKLFDTALSSFAPPIK